MTEFHVGDRVKIGEIDFNDVWGGCEGVVTAIKDYATIQVEVDGPAVDISGHGKPPELTHTGFFHPGSLTIIPINASFEDLRRVVDSLRSQGYDVEASVTSTVTRNF